MVSAYVPVGKKVIEGVESDGMLPAPPSWASTATIRHH